MAERWKLTEFTLDDAEEFDKICDDAELAKEAGEDDPYKVSKKQLKQVFGDHYVILTNLKEQAFSKINAENMAGLLRPIG